MKYTISCRQTLPIAAKAEEIRVDYKDIERLADFIKDYTDKEYVIYIENESINWDQLITYHKVLPKITIACADTTLFEACAAAGFPYFWIYPITTFYELRGLLDLGVSQVLLGAPLYFDIYRVSDLCKPKGVEIRLIANLCYNDYIKRKNGITGTYVRPEDVDFYDQCVDHLEFVSENLTQERTYLEIYKEKKTWPGNLNLILRNLNYNIDNRGFNSEFARRRIACGQRCQFSPESCHFCPSTFRFITNLDKNTSHFITSN